jgi:phosphatidylcholine synthase
MDPKKLIAIGVHIYSSMGLLLALAAALALTNHDVQQFLILLWLAVLIDSSDGTLARYFHVSKILPEFNGRLLEDIVDYLNYVFLPSLALIEFNLLTPNLTWIAALPLLASAYGFCQQQAKTAQSFVGFPSYWNVVFLYLYLFSFPAWLVAASIALFSILVFVPIRYVYPSHTKWMREITLVLSILYAIIVGALCLFPNASWAAGLAVISLFYPVYYGVVSILHHGRQISE